MKLIKLNQCQDRQNHEEAVLRHCCIEVGRKTARTVREALRWDQATRLPRCLYRACGSFFRSSEHSTLSTEPLRARERAGRCSTVINLRHHNPAMDVARACFRRGGVELDVICTGRNRIFSCCHTLVLRSFARPESIGPQGHSRTRGAHSPPVVA